MISENWLQNPYIMASLFAQIIEGLQYCHKRGVAHRDLTPMNILIHNGIPKIADFWLCQYINRKQLMETFCGSAYYSSPECFLMDPFNGQLTDMWMFHVLQRASCL
jgi:serine/threonine protein kinase